MAQRVRTADGTGLARAIDYTLKRWVAVMRYVEDGALPIDNNSVENVIRPIALGRRNWLFTGSERAGCRAAAIQSLLATAKLNGLEPCVAQGHAGETAGFAVQPDRRVVAASGLATLILRQARWRRRTLAKQHQYLRFNRAATMKSTHDLALVARQMLAAP